MFNTPVAFLIFNRPQPTETVFREIARVRPRRLLVVADGPRTPEEAEKCEQTRAVVGKVDWDCEVSTNFAEKNLGCRRRVSSGLDWVFSEVEEAIVVEDDCLPAPSFFPFCAELLGRYRDDERVMQITGDNFRQDLPAVTDSYYFSKYNPAWGWASWSRAWRHFDVDMKGWPEGRDAFLSSVLEPHERHFWRDTFDRVHSGEIDTWDYQWLYACLSRRGLTATPRVNLVSNIGFGAGATHTTGDVNSVGNLARGEVRFPLRHPSPVSPDAEADRFLFNVYTGGVQVEHEGGAVGAGRTMAARAAGLMRRVASTLRRG